MSDWGCGHTGCGEETAGRQLAEGTVHTTVFGGWHVLCHPCNKKVIAEWVRQVRSPEVRAIMRQRAEAGQPKQGKLFDAD